MRPFGFLVSVIVVVPVVELLIARGLRERPGETAPTERLLLLVLLLLLLVVLGRKGGGVDVG